jgi:divalent metal cation (Fe/Co/Zn/Cd) transporter
MVHFSGTTDCRPTDGYFVATIIAYNAIGLFRENFSFLVGRSPGHAYLVRVENLARSVPGVLDIHHVRAEYIGPDTVHVDMHITVGAGLTVGEGGRIAKKVQKHIHEDIKYGYCMIHVDEVEAGKEPS